MIALIICLSLVAASLVYTEGWMRGCDNGFNIANWGTGFDDGWKRGWEDGYYSGLMKGLGLTDDDRETLKEKDSEKA